MTPQHPQGASFGLRAVSAAAVTGFTLAATCGLTMVHAPAARAATSATQEYSTGYGQYARMIQWIDWRAGQNFATAADMKDGFVVRPSTLKVGTYVEQELAPGYIVRAEVAALGGITTPNSIGTAADGGTNNMPMYARTQDSQYSDIRQTGYPVSGWGVLSPNGDGGNVSAKIKLTATRDGVSVPVDAVFADGENAALGEFSSGTTDGAPWIPLFNTNNIDGTRPMWIPQTGFPANAGFGTATFGNIQTANRRVPVGMSRDAKNIEIKVSSKGMQNAMLGFFFAADSGDAPASYGRAIAQLEMKPNAELTTVNPIQYDDKASDAPKLIDQSSIYFGTTKADADTVFTGTWTNDSATSATDTRLTNDESLTELFDSGAFPGLAQCTATYTMTVNATAPDGTPVAGWIDFNNNGTFDTAERTQGTVQGGKATLTFAGSRIPDGITNVGSRIWISSSATSIQTPIGASPDGEVQDHLIPVTDKCVPTTSTGLQGQVQTSDAKAMFPSTNLTGAAFNFGKDADGAPILSQPALDASGATVGTYTIDPATGVVTFTPNPDFVGTPVPATVRVDLANGNTFESTYTPTVTPVTPASTPDASTTPQGTAVTLSPLTNDTAGDPTAPLKPETLQLTAEGLPEGSTVAEGGKSAIVPGEGTYTVNNDGTVTFTPEPDFVGTATPVKYTVQDANGTPTSSTIAVTVVGVDDVSGTGDQGQPVAVPPALSGVDPTTVKLLPAGLPAGSTVAEDGKSAIVPGEGTWTVDATTGVMTFKPEPGFTGDPTPIQYTGSATPGGATVPPATVTVDYPDVQDVSGTGDQGTPVTVKPALDEDTLPGTVTLLPDGLPAGTTVAEGGKSAVVPGQGTWTVTDDGSITFTPEDGFTGDPTPVKFTATDKDGNTATPGTATINYPDVNDISGTGVEGQPVTLKPLLDEDTLPGTLTLLPDGLPAGSTVAEGGKSAVVPGEGTWTVNNDGSLTFTPEDGFTGDPTPIKFTAQDKDGNTATPGTATINYPGVDDITGTGDQGQPVTLTPLLDKDTVPGSVTLLPDGLPTGSTVAEGGKSAVVPGEGTWVVNEDGSLTFTPEDGFTGDPTPIKFTAQDKDGNTATPGTATVNYPDVDNISGTGDQGTPTTVKPPLDEDTLPGTVSLLPDGLPAGSTVAEGGKSATVPGEGTWVVNPDGSLTFTPEDGFTGDPTPITFTAQDKDGNTATPATATINYPDVDNISGTGEQGTPTTVKPPLDEDTLPGTVTLLPDGLPAGSTVAEGGKSATVPGEGTWVVNPDGSLTFTPEDGFTGDPTPITFTAQDKDGNTATPATATINYPDVSDITGSGAPGEPVTVTPPLDEDTLPGTLTLLPDGLPAGSTVAEGGKSAVVPGEGTWTVNDDGSLTFTPEDGFTSDPTPITFTAEDKDGNTATPATATINYPDVEDVTGTGEQGKPVTLTPVFDDDAVPGTVKLIPDGLPAGSVVNPDGKSAVVPGEGTWVVNDDGSLTFTPEDGFTGDPTPIKFTAADKDGNVTPPATATINYPDVDDISGTGEQGTPTTVKPPLDEDTIPGTVTLLPNGLPEGSTIGEGGTSAIVPGEGTWVVNPDGSLTFTPEDGFTGDPTPITFTAQDKDGNTATPATATINYPDVEDATGTGEQGKPVTVKPPLDEDTLPGTLTLLTDGLPDGSTISDGGKTVTVPGEGTWVVNEDGSLTFTPEDGFTDDPTPVQFTAQDKDGNTATPGTATINYPDVDNVTGTGEQGKPTTVKPPLDEDTIPETVTLLPNGLPDGSTVAEGGKSAVVPGEGTWVVNPDGSLTFTPEDGFQGDPTPIQFTAQDKDGNTATPATATINYPDVDNVSGTGEQGKPTTVKPPLDEDTIPGTVTLLPNGLPEGSTIGEGGKSASVPGEGTWVVNPDGSLTFTPDDGFTGDPTPITFTAKDKDGNTATPATATINYPDTNDATGNGPAGDPVTVYPTFDTDANPGTVKFSPDGLPAGSTVSEDGKTAIVPNEGTWTVNPDGSLTFTPEDGFTGDPTPIKYTVEDKDGNPSQPGTATIDYPQLDGASNTGEQGKPATATPTFDPNIDPGTVTFPKDGQPNGATPSPDGKTLVVPNEGTWTVNPDGSMTFTPKDGFTGDPTPVKFTAKDKNGNPAPPATATIYYPDVEDVTGSGETGKPTTVKPVLDKDTIPSSVKLIPDGLPTGTTISPDGKTAKVPGEGTWTVNPDGSITFTPEDGFTGNPTPIKYIATDKDGNPSRPGTATITYSKSPDNPAAPGNPAQPAAPVAPDSGTILPSWLATTGVNGLLAGGITAALVAAGVALRLVGRRKHK